VTIVRGPAGLAGAMADITGPSNALLGEQAYQDLEAREMW